MEEGLAQLIGGIEYAKHVCMLESVLCKAWLETVSKECLTAC